MRLPFACVVVSVLAITALAPAVAYAQGAIVGTANDTTAAALPGVTVEASSPVLIEGSRTTVTDARGQYRIVDLRPGVYTVTFSLAGFSTVTREGIQLSGSFTATVNADLRVGALEETITVSGQSPVVDVQNVRQERVITAEVIEAIPSARTAQNFAALTPGVTLAQASSRAPQDVGGQSGERQRILIHGSRYDDYSMTIDGITYNILNNAGSSSMITVDPGAVEEYSYELGANSSEVEKGGARVNVIPKEGGNRFSGSFFFTYNNGKTVADNLSPELIARGAGTGNPLERQLDVNPSFGGPIMKSRVWFFGSFRYQALDTGQPGVYHNMTPDFLYTPDLSRPAIDQWWIRQEAIRLTTQVTPRNKVSLHFFNNAQCACPQVRGVSPPDGTTTQTFPINWHQFVTWNSTLTNNLLLQAGLVVHRFQQDIFPTDESIPGLVSITEQSTGVVTRAATSYTSTPHKQQTYRAALNYVTGSHSLKGGFMLQHGSRDQTTFVNEDVNYTFLNGVPRSVRVNATPTRLIERVDRNLGIYIQDQWTVRQRLTLNLGLRFDQIKASVPAQSLPATRFVPAREYPAVSDVPNWKDVSPRLGVAYDLFGNGKTALKASLNRYVVGELVDFARANNPAAAAVTFANRTWNDLNRNFLPDCDLANPAQNAECGALSDQAFGQVRVRTEHDEALKKGWGLRSYNWETTLGVQHELRGGVAVGMTYYRRTFGNFRTTDNVLVTPADYDPFCVTAPDDAQLPGGGGYQLCGLYDISPAKFGQNFGFVTSQSTYGKQTEIYDGVDLTANVRLPGSALLQGGLNMGRTALNNCFVVDSPEALNFCETKPPFQPQLRFLASYPLPWDIRASLTFQSNPGPEILANYAATNAEIRPTLGRNLSSGVNGTVTVPLIEPGTLYGDRLNQVDMRVTKSFQARATRLRANVDLYNLFNANPVLTHNNTYGARWLQPQYILPGRMLKISAQVNF
jgi:outer membrane receptor protein involved in Fe transport